MKAPLALVFAVLLGLLAGPAVAASGAKVPPPGSSVEMPYLVAPMATDEAIQCVVATTPKVPLISGRVVKAKGIFVICDQSGLLLAGGVAMPCSVVIAFSRAS